MSAFKWSILFLLVVFPFFILAGDYMAHTATVDDATTAARSAAQAELKSNVVKNSLRDANVERKDSIVVKYEPNTIQTVFNDCLTRRVVQDSAGNDAYITIAQGVGIEGDEIQTLSSPYPSTPGFQAGGAGNPPPMIAVRATVVRDGLLYGILNRCFPSLTDFSQYDVIQVQEIAIVEAK